VLRSRVILAIVLLLTVVAVADVHANREAVFEGFVEGFEAVRPEARYVAASANGDIGPAEAGSASRVLIKLNLGSVRVVGDPAATSVSGTYVIGVKTASDRQNDKMLQETGVRTSLSSEGVLTITCDEPSVWPVGVGGITYQLDLVVPAGLQVEVDSHAAVEVRHIAGNVTIRGADHITVADIGGDLAVSSVGNGIVEVARISGATRIDGSAARASLADVGAQVTIELFARNTEIHNVGGDLELSIWNGSVNCTNIAGAVNVTGRMATVVVNQPQAAMTARMSGGSLTAIGPRGPLDIMADMSHVRVEVSPAAGFDVDMNLTMSALLSDYALETSGDVGHVTVRGAIGAGGNALRGSITGGTLELRPAR